MSDQPEQKQPHGENEPMGDSPATDGEPGSRAFLDEVRRVAGWRVSPRQLDAALTALGEAGEEPSPERAAEVAEISRGERSQRQRRNTELWRKLGAHLAVQGRLSDPAAQLNFIGNARGIAGSEATDFILLQVALRTAEEGELLTPRLVGQISRWILEHYGPDITTEEIADSIPEAMAAVAEAEERAPGPKPRPQRRLAQARPSRPRRRSTGRRPRGSSYGGKRRRRS